MTSIIDVFKRQSRYVRDSGFIVVVDEAFSWVSIKNEAEGQEILLQGHEADAFIKGYKEVWEYALDLTGDDALYGHAFQLVESLI